MDMNTIDPMDFDWDEDKAEANLKKHGVSFSEGGTIFSDPLAITYNDPDHSFDEERFLSIGFSDKDQLLIVSHVERAGKTRLISVRRATRPERRLYENG